MSSHILGMTARSSRLSLCFGWSALCPPYPPGFLTPFLQLTAQRSGDRRELSGPPKGRPHPCSLLTPRAFALRGFARGSHLLDCSCVYICLLLIVGLLSPPLDDKLCEQNKSSRTFSVRLLRWRPPGQCLSPCQASTLLAQFIPISKPQGSPLQGPCTPQHALMLYLCATKKAD